MAVVDTVGAVASVARRRLVAIALFGRVGVNSIFVAVIDTNELVAIDTAYILFAFSFYAT